MMQRVRHPRTRGGPILVLDPISRPAVAAVRGLGRLGWSVVVGGSEPRREALAATSRYADDRYERLPDPHGPTAPFAEALDEVVRRRRCQAIVAISDATIARLRGLETAVPTIPRLDVGYDAVIDKLALAAVCRRAGVAYPQTWVAGSPEDGSAPWPRIVKARRSAEPGPEYVAERRGASVVHDQWSQDAVVDDIRYAGLVPIVQTRVRREGKFNVAIVRSRGRTTFRIAYEVLIEFPPHGGQAAALISIDRTSGIGARAIDAAERVCDAASYQGLANMEFYRQPDGELCLLEVNPRVWGSMWFPERLWLRPLERAVLDALGEDPLPALDYPPGRRFHRPTLEARWLVSDREDRGSASRLLAVVRPWDVIDLLSATDPMPVLQGSRQVVSRWRVAIRDRGRALRR